MILTIEIIGSILIFSILIFVHEFGHFIAAKKFGVLVHEFAIGMGPIIWKKQGKETLYTIRCIPLGGFCKMEGEDEESEDERSFTKISWWKKIIVLAAGGVFNLVMGLILCIVMAYSAGTIIVAKVKTATNPQFAKNDIVLSINNNKMTYQEDVYGYMMSVPKEKATKDFNITIKRNNQVKEIVVKGKYDAKQGRYLLGYEAGVEKVGVVSGLKYGLYQFDFYSKYIINSLIGLISGKISLNNLSGPVGIVSTIGTAVGDVAKGANYAWQTLTTIFLLITINLGIFNLIPFPALDGGRIFFVLVQVIFRRKISADKEGIVHFVGFALLIGLILFATKNDIMRFFVK